MSVNARMRMRKKEEIEELSARRMRLILSLGFFFKTNLCISRRSLYAILFLMLANLWAIMDAGISRCLGQFCPFVMLSETD